MSNRVIATLAFSAQAGTEVLSQIPLDEIIKITTQLIIAIAAVIAMFRKPKTK